MSGEGLPLNHALGIDDLSVWLGMLQKIVDDSTNMVVVTDAERRIKWVNATYTRTTGWTLEECAGKRPRELLHGPATDTADLSRLANLLRQKVSVSNFELVNYKKSGEPYHVSLNIEPIHDSAGAVYAYLSIQSDITERRQLELRTIELSQRLEVAQRLARLGRIETDLASGRSRWSSEVYRILGMSPDETPRGFDDLLAFAHPEDLPALERATGASNGRGDEVELEFRVVGVHGGRRWVRCRGVPLLDGGGYRAPVVWSVQDITLYKERLEEKRLRNEVLNQLVLARTRKLEESNRALEEFSYALSHDLRTPLRHVVGFAELLKEELGSGSFDACAPYCDRILGAAGKMQRLIEGMLSFARFGRDGLRVAPIDLAELIRDVVAGLASDAGPSEIRWRIEQGLPTVQGDPVLMREVWVNLLGNALKYSGHRDISEIEVGWHAHPEGWVLFVRDNGVGFDPAQADKLFGMFQRLHRSGRFPGEGIGLALVRRIVESHGGRIWATSRVDQGATFYFFLPATVGGGAEPGDLDANGTPPGESPTLELKSWVS